MQEENLIALLKETLKFYGDYRNYDSGMVISDGGHMARFALEQVKKLEEMAENLKQKFEELQNKVTDKTPEEITKMINDLTKENGRKSL